MENKIKVGVIGLGMGKAHLEGYSKIPEVEIIAICDINDSLLKKQAEKFNVRYTFSDYHKLLEMEELNAVSIALPNFLHCPVALEALDKEKHVLVEKPLAMNSQEAEEMVKKAREKKRILAVAMNYRFTPEMSFLKRIIEKGQLGEIYYIRTIFLRRKTFAQKFAHSNDPRTWFVRKEKSGGGVLIDLGPHLIDLAMWLSNDFNGISCYGVTFYKMNNGDVDDLASALIKLSKGVLISLESSWESFTKERFFTSIFGTEGGAETHPLRIYKEVNGVDVEINPELKNENETETETVQYHFIESIKKGKEPEFSGEKGLAVMKVIDAIYKSAEIGKEVKI